MFASTIRRLNDRRDGAGADGADAGFTLIELMVVLLILAILLAIAIPTFLGVTKSANDRAAQSNLNTAITNAQAQYQAQGQSYCVSTGCVATSPAAFVTAVSSAEPSLTFGTTNSATQANISVWISTDGNGLVVAAFSKSSNNCWYIFENPATPTQTTDAPWTGTATASGVTAATTIVVPSSLGTTYAEVKGDTTASDCNAQTPKISGSASVYQYAQSSFPS